jgi:hypothetical protein
MRFTGADRFIALKPLVVVEVLADTAALHEPMRWPTSRLGWTT